VKQQWLCVVHALAFAVFSSASAQAQSPNWSIAGTILTPDGIIADSAISIRNGAIAAIGPSATLPNPAAAVTAPGIIIPGFIDLHNHLTWNVLPRWIPSRKFNNRYEWQDTAEYDRVLVQPHNAVLNAAACESEIYAEIKAIAGGATSVVGSLLPSKESPHAGDCAIGLARNLDVASGFNFKQPGPNDPCLAKGDPSPPLLDVADNEVFPFELTHPRFDYLACELAASNLKALIVHLSEGANTDSSAHREFTMLDREGLLQPGLVIIHGTAIRPQEFPDMAKNKVGLVWSPRSNDELYGSTTNITAALSAGVAVAIAPDWSPSGSAGMLQEMGYIARRYPSVAANDLVAMATSIPARLARIDDKVGSLTPGRLADFVVINTKIDPHGPRPLAAVANANPANIALVVVGGQPIYGDPELLAQTPLPAGAKLEALTVCGAQKALYLGQSDAAARHESLADITRLLNAALASAGSHLPDIECD
jgi:5-methylthioadenosine/S-adenosylhomocysteine deaminase